MIATPLEPPGPGATAAAARPGARVHVTFGGLLPDSEDAGDEDQEGQPG